MKKIRLEQVGIETGSKPDVKKIPAKNKLHMGLANFINCQLNPVTKARYDGLNRFMKVINKIQPTKKKQYELDVA